MKTKSLFSVLLFVIFFYSGTAQVPKGFNYQAIARDETYNPITGTALPVTITIQSDSLGGTIFWQELHSSVVTNDIGLFTLIIGDGDKQPASTVESFSDIDWSVTPKYIKTEIYYQDEMRNMGSTRFWSVPYSKVAEELSGTLNKLEVTGTTINMEEALFEVKNNNSQTVFAVYNEGVRIYVDDGDAKGIKGGFAIGGFAGKAEPQEYLRVTRDSTRVYINQAAKASKGGFAIGGFGAKAEIDNLLDLTKNNYFIGHQAGMSNDEGLYNSFIGYQAGLSNTGGDNNIFMGFNAGYENTNGNDNIFIGNQAGKASDAYSNVFIGHNAGVANTNGGYNIFIGELSGYNNLGGSENIFLGYEAGVSNKGGTDNIYIGPFSANSIQEGMANVIIGIEAATDKTAGEENVLIGSWSNAYGNTGSGNVMIGKSTGEMNEGDYNVFIGYEAGAGETGSNKLYINNSSGSPLIYGDFTDGSEKLVFNGDVGIGTNSPEVLLQVGENGDGSLARANTWSTWSDITLKTGLVRPVNPLEMISGINGYYYYWKEGSDQTRQIGFSAQEVEQVLPEVVSKGNDGLLSLDYGKVTPLLVEAIKEQQKIINVQKGEIEALKTRLEELESVFNK